MRVLLITESKTEAAELTARLESARFEVRSATHAQARASVQERVPDVMLVAEPQDNTFLQTLRVSDEMATTYTVALLHETPSGPKVSAILLAGFHDFVRFPCSAEELRARVDPAARLRHWVLSRARVQKLDWSAPVQPDDLRAWNFLGDLVSLELAQMFDHPVHVREGWEEPPGNLLTATIPMTLSSSKMRVRVSIAAGARTLSWLGQHLLDTPAAGGELLADSLREMANMAGGAFKRAALLEGITFATGLPTTNGEPAAGTRSRCWTLTWADGTSLGVIGHIDHRENIRILVGAVREGMVVSQNVRSESGLLLVAADTRLTETSAERLRERLGPKDYVEVAS